MFKRCIRDNIHSLKGSIYGSTTSSRSYSYKSTICVLNRTICADGNLTSFTINAMEIHTWNPSTRSYSSTINTIIPTTLEINQTPDLNALHHMTVYIHIIKNN